MWGSNTRGPEEAGPLSMICDVTNSLGATPGPIFSIHNFSRNTERRVEIINKGLIASTSSTFMSCLLSGPRTTPREHFDVHVHEIGTANCRFKCIFSMYTQRVIEVVTDAPPCC